MPLFDPELCAPEVRKVIGNGLQRRRFTAGHKLSIVAETMRPGISTTFVARRHGLSPSLIFRWRRELMGVVREKAFAEDAVPAAPDLRRLADRVRELERVLGRKTMEIEMLKEALEVSQAAGAVVGPRSADSDDPLDVWPELPAR